MATEELQYALSWTVDKQSNTSVEQTISFCLPGIGGVVVVSLNRGGFL
jgi:hypothetical protein